MKVIIIEDETAAAENLKALIREVKPSAAILATLESVADSVAWLRDNPSPDLIFMDIHLADGDAFKIFTQIDIKTPIVFTTAYDKYALDAFKVNSIDYLLKPIKSDELDRALRKLELLTQTEKDDYADKISTVATTVAENASKQQTFLVHVRDKLLPVRVKDIAFFFTFNEQVHAYTFDGGRYPVEGSLDSIIGAIDEVAYFRANRQFVISREAITDISVWFGSRICINLMVEAPEKIIVSKARVPEFKRWIRGAVQ